jgi:hypothetical protein
MASAFVRSALTVGSGWGCALVCASLVLPCRASLQAQPAEPAAASPTVSTPFKPEPPVRSYVAIRRLESDNQRHHKEAWLVVQTELKEDGSFTWQVLEEGGSELIRKRVLHEALEKEAQVHKDGRARRGGLTPENYVFSAPTPADGVIRVGIEPRRREEMLVRGALLMSPEGELLRVEGDLVKRPSFWTKSVHLIRHYGRVDGTHVPIRLDMVAQVRLVGTSRLSMTYRYLQINGRPVQDDSRPVSLITRAGSAPRAASQR